MKTAEAPVIVKQTFEASIEQGMERINGFGRNGTMVFFQYPHI